MEENAKLESELEIVLDELLDFLNQVLDDERWVPRLLSPLPRAVLTFWVDTDPVGEVDGRKCNAKP
jgi:hypothetical protein